VERHDDRLIVENYEEDVRLRISMLRTKWLEAIGAIGLHKDQIMQYLFTTLEYQQKEIEGLRLYIATGTDPKEAE